MSCPGSNPLVSVIIPAYNAERFVREAIDSALAQTYSPIEVVCVNDASTDNTAEILGEYGGRITRVSLSENRGPASRNAGVEASRGDWLGFLNADDLWDPRKLEVQMAAIGHGHAVIHSAAQFIDIDGRPTGMRPPPSKTEDVTFVDLLGGDKCCIVTALVQREAFESVGGFDAGTRHAEDWQLGLRLAAVGHTFLYIDQVLAFVRRHDANTTHNGIDMNLGMIRAIQQTRREYPTLFGRHEGKLFHRQMARFLFTLGWIHQDKGDYGPAAKAFWRAIWHAPGWALPWPYAVATSLPFRGRLIPGLKRLVRRGDVEAPNA